MGNTLMKHVTMVDRELKVFAGGPGGGDIYSVLKNAVERLKLPEGADKEIWSLSWFLPW
jgi:hypothetical protein